MPPKKRRKIRSKGVGGRLIPLTYLGPNKTTNVNGYEVMQGETIEVSQDVAGRPQSPEYAEAERAFEDAAAADDLERAQQEADKMAEADAGQSLLAQPESWQPEGTGRGRR